MKNGVNIVTIILSLAAIILSGYVLLTVSTRKIVVSFNTNSNSTLSNLEILEGESINLPVPEKDGYDFLGWYVNDERIDDNYKFHKTTVLSAKWEKIEELNNELIIYCGDTYYCHDEAYFDNQIIYGGMQPINKDSLHKYIIKTKTPNAVFFNSVSNYALYEDDGLKIYDLKEQKTIINHLNNNSNAKYLTLRSNFILYRDNNLKLYDINAKKIVNDQLNLDANLEKYQLYLSEDETRVIGIGYIKNNYVEYYNILNGKSLYSGKYKSDDLNTLSDLVQINDHYLSFNVNNFPDNDVLLLSCEEEKVVLSDKTNSGGINYVSYGKNGKYIYAFDYMTQDVSNYFRVYSNEFKPLFEGNGFKGDNYQYRNYINIGDYVYILDGKTVKKYDYDGKLIASKEYNNAQGLVNRLNLETKFDEYKMSKAYIVYVKNNNLVLENFDDENESKVITAWKDKMGVGLLSYYTKEEANKNARNGQTYEEGVYVSVTDKTDQCTATVTEYCYNNNKEIITYQSYSRDLCVAVPAKPLIYLYPEKEMDIEVKLGNISNVTTIYPKYYNGWKVKAYPNGKLIDLNTNRELYGLYWEGKNYPGSKSMEGFVIKGEDTASFLEEKLAILGLTEREAEEFIIYWLPQMEHNAFNYIKFASKEEIDEYMPLIINPKPDTLIRVLMEFMPLDSKINVKEQKLEKVERNGFVAVEWGGLILQQDIIR